MTFRNKLILYDEMFYPTPNSHAGGPPLVGCPRLLIQYIRSYPPYLEAVSSVLNPRTRRAVVTRDPPNVGYTLLSVQEFKFLLLFGGYKIVTRKDNFFCC
jgi:hypothetical protein